jgi:small subunit ribosomal protein S6|tara:strand:+ start:10699 stop:11094 length:396 start_codon:yes stop_codon:yes gene_type:complete
MALYECVFIARQDLSQTQAESLIGKFEKVIKDNDGKIANNEYWGLRPLAYIIKKNKRGHYAMLNVDAPSAAIQEMERQMRFDENVIRFLSIRVDAFKKEPSIMMNQRNKEAEIAAEFGVNLEKEGATNETK